MTKISINRSYTAQWCIYIIYYPIYIYSVLLRGCGSLAGFMYTVVQQSSKVDMKNFLCRDLRHTRVCRMIVLGEPMDFLCFDELWGQAGQNVDTAALLACLWLYAVSRSFLTSSPFLLLRWEFLMEFSRRVWSWFFWVFWDKHVRTVRPQLWICFVKTTELAGMSEWHHAVSKQNWTRNNKLGQYEWGCAEWASQQALRRWFSSCLLRLENDCGVKFASDDSRNELRACVCVFVYIEGLSWLIAMIISSCSLKWGFV